jgi:hypothetical protein
MKELARYMNDVYTQCTDNTYRTIYHNLAAAVAWLLHVCLSVLLLHK